ncbi:MAG: hypothetical protein WCP34_15640 [Pseudomonadota bacterium]
MKKWVLALYVTMATVPAAAGDFLGDVGRDCVFGAAVWGISSMVLIYPAMTVSLPAPARAAAAPAAAAARAATATTSVPLFPLVVSSALFGCGVGTAVSLMAHSVGSLYDNLFATGGTGAEGEQTVSWYTLSSQ